MQLGKVLYIYLQLSRREITIQQLEHELSQVKAQYRESVEENGRLEARIQAFAINAQSEQDVLNSEVIIPLPFKHQNQQKFVLNIL